MRQFAVAPLSDGRLQLWAIDNFGRLYTSWKTNTASDADWTPWVDFFAQIGALPEPVLAVAVGPLSDGRLQLWALDSTGHIYSTWKATTDSGAPWTDWVDFLEVVPLSNTLGGLSAARMGDGRLALFATDGLRVWVTAKRSIDSGDGWTAWQDLNLPRYACDHCNDGSCQCGVSSARCAAHRGVDPSVGCSR